MGVDDETKEAKELRIRMEQDGSRQPRVTKAPAAPTQKEKDEHYPLHIKFKSWCPYCVAGQGISDQHRSLPDGHGNCVGITVSMDYCFMTDDEKVEGTPPVLVMFDSNSKGLWALQADSKAVTKHLVKFVADRLDDAGYAGVKVTLTSDQEESMLALKKAVAVTRRAETCPIESPVRESKANGLMERLIRS